MTRSFLEQANAHLVAQNPLQAAVVRISQKNTGPLCRPLWRPVYWGLRILEVCKDLSVENVYAEPSAFGQQLCLAESVLLRPVLQNQDGSFQLKETLSSVEVKTVAASL